MTLVKAQCTNCNGILDVDSGKDAAVCPFCGTPYVIEKAIQLYQTHNNFLIQGAVFENSISEDLYIKRGVKQLELEMYEDAKKTFIEMTQNYPENYKGWLGLCIIESQTDKGLVYQKHIDNTVVQCPAEKTDELDHVLIYSHRRINQIECDISSIKQQIECLNREISCNEERYSNKEKIYGESENKMNNQLDTIAAIGFLMVPVIGFFICGSSVGVKWVGVLMVLLGLILIPATLKYLLIERPKENKRIRSKMHSIEDEMDSIEKEISESKKRKKILKQEITQNLAAIDREQHYKKKEFFINLIKE